MNQTSIDRLIRLGIGLVTFGVVFYLLRSLDVIPAVMESVDPGKLGTPTGTTKINGLEIVISMVVAAFVVWKYSGDVVAIVTRSTAGSETGPSVTVREQLANLTDTMPDAERLRFEQLTLQAIYENDMPSVKACIEKLTGATFDAKLAPRAKTPSRPKSKAKQ